MVKEEEGEEEEVKRRVYLYLSLCGKNEALIGGLFEVYGQARGGERSVGRSCAG